MVEDMLVVALACGRIYGHQDGTNLLDSEVHHIPLRTVVGYHHHAVAFVHAQANQSLADYIGHLHEVAADVLLPRTVHLTGKHHFLFAILLYEPRQQVEGARRNIRIGLNGFPFVIFLIHSNENCCEIKV